MKRKNTIAFKVFTCFVISLFLLSYLPVSAEASYLSKPAAPTGLAASSITQTSVTLTWNSTSGASYYKVYKNGSLYRSSLYSTSVSITGLSAGTTYSFAVSAYSSRSGEGDKSSPLSVTTLSVVPAAPTGLTASAVTQTSAVLTWNTVSGAASYKLYKNGSLYSSPTMTTDTITGLTASTTYSFQVSAVNSGGEGAKSTALSLKTLATGVSASTLNILEVQPYDTYDLSTSLLAGAFPNSTVNLTQMSMAEFISKVEEINGRYDIVYIGDNTSEGPYTALGTAPKNLPQGGLNNGTGTSKEYYSDNDITDRRSNKLKDFINSKQLTIFDQSIFGSGLTNTKLYSNFLSYKGNPTYPNFTTVNTASSKNANLQAAFSVYNTSSSIVKRPQLKINSPATDMPKIYDGSDASYQADKSLSFKFDISTKSPANNMKVKLYIDVNGDGIYKETPDYAGNAEAVYEKDNLSSLTGYTLNYHLPDSFIGLQPWKLEVTDTASGAKSYITGATAFKGNSGEEVRLRLLQLEPSGNTFSIYSLHNVQGQNLLYKDQVYRIDVTEMNIDDFNNAYSHATPAPAAAVVNGVKTTAPTVLNGNYDMIIMGFADIYGGDDLTNTNAINALKNFIATNQSVMLTHDTLTFQVNSPNTWGYNITQNLRNTVGQQRYYRTAPDTNRTYDPMPSLSQNSYGFTNLTLGRYNNGVTNNGDTFDTTTKTHKINDNLVTEFPFPLGDITVSPTHFQYFQLDLEDENVVPVYTLTNDGSSKMYNHPGDGRNDYYTYTKGSITFSGTGHSNVGSDNSIDEEKMFINTIIKASRGANHAPTLDVQGISDGMDIANTQPSIDFNFTATDIDLNDQYQNADIYWATSSDGTTFTDYKNFQHFSASDPDLSKRVKSAVAQAVSIPTEGTDIKAYKVKVVVYDSSNAMASQEFTLNSVPDPQVSVQNYSTSCLVGDHLTIPVNVAAQATSLTETFKNVKVVSILTAPDGTSTTVNTATYPDVAFSPGSSWPGNIQEKDFSQTLNTAGNYTILNKLTYDAYNGVSPNLTNETSRENDQTFNISVGSGTLEVEVLDSKDRGIPGVTVNVTGSHTGTTSASGFSSFSGLSTGDYTVSITAPPGFAIEGNSSQTVSLGAANNLQKINFKLSGDLLANPSITSQGSTAVSVFKDNPLETELGLTLNRPVHYINLDLANTLNDGSTMDVVINKVYCNNTETPFAIDVNDSAKIIPEQPETSFPSGSYKIEATITINGSSVQGGQSYQIVLTQRTSAEDANSGYEDTLASPSQPLTVNLLNEDLIMNPKITTLNGANQVSILKGVPLQTVVGFDLTRPASYLTIDISNDLGSTMNVDLSNLRCDSGGGDQPIGFTIDSNDPEKLLPGPTNTSFPGGTYKLNANITISGLSDNVSFILTLTDKTTAQDAANPSYIDCIDPVSLKGLKVNVGTAPPLH